MKESAPLMLNDWSQRPTVMQQQSCNDFEVAPEHPIKKSMSAWRMVAMSAFLFSTGLLLATYGMITLAVEARRLAPRNPTVVLPIFLVIAGVSQLVCPLAGYLSDRCVRSSSKFARRRPFISLGSLVLAVALGLQWICSRRHWSAALYAFFFMISMVAVNFAYTATTSLVPDLVPPSQTGLANGIATLAQVAGAFFGFLFFFAVAKLNALYAVYVFSVLTGAAITLWGGSSAEAAISNRNHDDEDRLLSTLSSTAGGQHNPSQNQQAAPFSWAAVRRCYYVSATDPRTADFAFVWISRTLYYTGGSAQAFLQFYIRDRMRPTLQDVDLFATLMPTNDPARATCAVALVGYVAGLCSAVPAGALSDRFGRKPVVVFACFLMSMAMIGLGSTRATPMNILAWSLVGKNIDTLSLSLRGLTQLPTGGLGNGAYQAVDLALAVDTLPDPVESARYMGVWGVGAFVGVCFGPVIGTPLLYFFGRVHHEDPTSNGPAGYFALFLFSASCLLASAAVLVVYVKKAR